jgi:hypothetical protein
MMGVGCATALAKACFVKCEVEEGTRLLEKANGKGMRYVDDLRVFVIVPRGSSRKGVNEKFFPEFMRMTYVADLPWKVDCFNPFIGHHFGIDPRLAFAWWPCSKALRPTGETITNQNNEPMRGRQHWQSWGRQTNKIGSLLGALATCASQARDSGCSLVGAAVICQDIVQAAGYPASLVGDMAEGYFGSRNRFHYEKTDRSKI